MSHDGHQHAGPTGGFWPNLFEVFTPRRVCMNDDGQVVWLHLVADLLIALAYFSIPLALVVFVRRRRDLAFNWMFLLFALFIVLCGTTHLFNVWALWQPVYRFDGVVKLVTGGVSLATAALLWKLLPVALTLPSPEQLRQLNADLERRVDERTADLERANAALREADRRKDEFLAMLAHELRNPLAPIVTGLDVLGMIGAQSADAVRIRATMERQARHLARLVDDLLDVSRIQQDNVQLKRTRVAVGPAVEQAADAVRPMTRARGHALELDLPPADVAVHADPVRLVQVFTNLLHNAAKYTDPGGRITVTGRAEGGAVVVRVRDTGEGMPAELIPHVFDTFRQGDRTLARSEGGLGLGLTLVRRLVERHGGTVTAHSEGVGRGSEFVVRLPALPADDSRLPNADDVRAGGDQPSSGGNALRVLVVEDRPDVAESMRELLTARGHSVRVAADGPAGLEAARADRPDVVLLDLGLPGMDGYELARRLRQEPGARRPWLVAVSGYARPEDVARSRAAGCDLHLAKPVSREDLEAALAAAVL